MDPREFSGGSDSDPQPQVNIVKVDAVLSPSGDRAGQGGQNRGCLTARGPCL
jgi:hypothetical protein